MAASVCALKETGTHLKQHLWCESSVYMATRLLELFDLCRPINFSMIMNKDCLDKCIFYEHCHKFALPALLPSSDPLSTLSLWSIEPILYHEQ